LLSGAFAILCILASVSLRGSSLLADFRFHLQDPPFTDSQPPFAD
jgi:hypothetical protein